MFSKAGITAEEMKLQLGDRLPIAMKALEKSTGKTAKELLKMMEMGQLSAEYIVPFTRAFREMATVNDALANSLKSGKTAQDRFMVFLKESASLIYESGFEEGLTELFNSMSKALEDGAGALKGLGQVFKLFFTIVKSVGSILIPFIDSLMTLVGGLASVLNKVLSTDMGQFTAGLSIILLYLAKVNKALGIMEISAAKAFAPITAVLSVGDEVYSLFDDTRTGFLEEGNESQGFLSLGKSILPSFARNIIDLVNGVDYKDTAEGRFILNNNVYVDGVARTAEDHMEVTNSSALVSGR